jgi:hypothetical protein
MLEQALVGPRIPAAIRRSRYLHQDVEVVAHHAIGPDLHLAEACVAPHQVYELLAFLPFEHEALLLGSSQSRHQPVEELTTPKHQLLRIAKERAHVRLRRLEIDLGEAL